MRFNSHREVARVLITQFPNLSRHILNMHTSGQQQPFAEVPGSMPSLLQGDCLK